MAVRHIPLRSFASGSLTSMAITFQSVSPATAVKFAPKQTTSHDSHTSIHVAWFSRTDICLFIKWIWLSCLTILHVDKPWHHIIYISLHIHICSNFIKHLNGYSVVVQCCAQLPYVVHHLHHLLCSTRFSFRAAIVHRLHGGPHYNSGEAWCITACIRRRHAVVPALSSWRHSVSTAATQRERCIADVGRWMSGNRLKLNTDKPSYCGSDQDTVFTSTTFAWLSCSSWPCPFAVSNDLVRS